jgi:hypothetical protein
MWWGWRLLSPPRQPSRLMKNVHLQRSPDSPALQGPSMDASRIGISGALHLDVFDPPA